MFSKKVCPILGHGIYLGHHSSATRDSRVDSLIDIPIILQICFFSLAMATFPLPALHRDTVYIHNVILWDMSEENGDNE